MKILIVRTIAMEEDFSVRTYNVQGLGLATELSRLGNECALVYYAKKGNRKVEKIISDGFEIKVFHIEGISFIGNAIYNKELYDICSEYDVIQTSECDQICSYLLYKKFPNKTVIYHGPYKSSFTKKYNLRSHVFDFLFLHKSNFTNATVISKSILAEKYLRDKGFEKVTTLGVGLDPNAFDDYQNSIPSKVEDVINNKGDNQYLLYVGAISKRKNFKFILRLLNELVNAKKNTNFKLLVVGGKGHKEDAYYDECFTYIEIHNLKSNVIYLGVLPQGVIHYVYRHSDLFLFPTLYDIYGMVILEAMYFGIPVISSNCGATQMMIESGDNGIIIDTFSIEEWSKSVIEVLSDVKYKNMLSQNATKKILNEFTWKQLSSQFLHVYESVINSQ